MNKFSIRYDRKKFTKSQIRAIEAALQMAVSAHDGQLRASGEPYIIHPIAVAETVAAWGLDHEAVMAALLHDVVEDTEATSETLSDAFGPKVAELVEGVTKLRLSTSPRPAADSARLESSNENLRKLLLATTKDYRVMLIKLADRLHNLRTLQYLPPQKQAEVARESLQIYAPLADRLGMGRLKGELEDLGFRYAQPEEYLRLEKQVQTTTRKSARYLAALKKAISVHLAEGGVSLLGIEARRKHLYSIHKKLVKVEGDIDKIYDLMAVRVIVPDIAACYQALGILHQHYKPLIYRIKDYIAVPKPNGYRSLHTTVFAEDGHITEIQIRTPEMHETAEYGLAAHFFYDVHKESKAYAHRAGSGKTPDSLKWVSQLNALQRATASGQEFVEGAKLELFTDRIFVFSPKGDLYELPEGSTPLDFAFAVHSDVGLHALGAKVNGRMQPLDAKLQNRDVVEIVTRQGVKPSRDWLGFVVTAHAKNRIRSWFRAESREANTASGRLELEEALRAWGVRRLEDLPKRVVADALDALHAKSLDELLAQLGDGTFSVTQVIRKFVPDAAKPADVPVVKRTEPTGRVLIEGEQLPYILAPCCNPVFPQPLLGYVTRGKGVTVHALGCRNVPTDVERYVTCRWETMLEAPERFVCRVAVRAVNRIGLILDITSVIAALRLNIAGMATKHLGVLDDETEPETMVTFGLEVPDLFALASAIRKLERLPGVIEVSRIG
jgi:guanosine-3',5'-bis(diphosphate) 3'-pyrophosphohydrolase